MLQQAPPASSPWQIASCSGWMAARGMQTFFVIAFLEFGYLVARSGQVLRLVSYLLIIWVVFAYCHRFATGEIFQDGVRFRRYFSERHFSFSRAVIFSHLDSDFIFNPETSAIPYCRHRHGLDTPLLPVLERIHALTGDTPPIASVPAQPRWIMRAFMGLTLLLVTVMLMRLFTHF